MGRPELDLDERERLRLVSAALFWCVGHLEGLKYPVIDRPFIRDALRVANPIAAEKLLGPSDTHPPVGEG